MPPGVSVPTLIAELIPRVFRCHVRMAYTREVLTLLTVSHTNWTQDKKPTLDCKKYFLLLVWCVIMLFFWCLAEIFSKDSSAIGACRMDIRNLASFSGGSPGGQETRNAIVQFLNQK